MTAPVLTFLFTGRSRCCGHNEQR